MAKKKTVKTVEEDTFDYDKPRNLIERYLAKAVGESITLPDTDNERILVYLRKLIEVIEDSGGGTEVVANPTLAGTEDALTGLQVGDTKYKVPSVPHLYRHDIIVRRTTTGINVRASFTILSENNTPFTYDTLVEYLDANGYTSTSYLMACSGTVRPTSTAGFNALYGAYRFLVGETKVFAIVNYDSFYTVTNDADTTVSDMVIQIF